MAQTYIHWNESPRIVEIVYPGTQMTVQELHNNITTLEHQPPYLSYKRLIVTSGKQNLGTGEYVGLTGRLLNGMMAFTPRTQSSESGSVTTPDSKGITLYDSTAQFQTNGVNIGATVINFTDRSVTTVKRVVSEFELYCWPLGDGSDNQWDTADQYKVWNEVQCEVSSGNITAVDDIGDPLQVVMPTFGTQVVVAKDTTAALLEPGFLDKLLADHRINGSVAEAIRKILYRSQ